MVEWFSYGQLILIAVILGSAFIAVTIGKYAIRKSINKASSEQKDKDEKATGLQFLLNTLSFLVYTIAVIAVIYTIPPFRTIGKTLFAGAGILAAIIGFASQQAFSNIISGIFLVLFKPFRMGDLIKIGNSEEGFVEDITLRHTVIRDYENKRIVVPNSMISTQTIINANIKDERVMNRLPFSISYESDMDKAMDIIRNQAVKHPMHRDYRSETELSSNKPDVDVRVISWDESGITLRAWIWTETPLDGFELRTDLLYSIKKEFELNNIEIPYPHRTIINKG